MRLHLTELAVRKLSSSDKQVKVWDSSTPGFGIRTSFKRFLDTLPDDPVEAPKSSPERTGQQNNGMHLWFEQTARICQNQGVTMDLIIKHTHDVLVTKEGVKLLWKTFQKALFDTDSTTQLKKTGQIDILVDHMVALFAKVGVELPPFPCDEQRFWAEQTGYKSDTTKELPGAPYPKYDEERHKPTI